MTSKEKFPAWGEDDPVKLANFSEEIASVMRRIEAARVPDLLEHLRRFTIQTGIGADRVPLGLIQESKPKDSPDSRLYSTSKIEELPCVQPYCTIRITHLVVDPETACGFDLVSLQLANVNLNIAESDIPLETFSLEFIRENESLFAIQQFQCPTISPANRLRVVVRRHAHYSGLFRGVLWANVLAIGSGGL